MSDWPVVAVEVVEPAALFDELDAAGAVPPGGVAVRALVLLSLTTLHAAAVRLLDLPVNVKVQALARLHLGMTGSWADKPERKRQSQTLERLKYIIFNYTFYNDKFFII